jgi:hypothetical protein
MIIHPDIDGQLAVDSKTIDNEPVVLMIMMLSGHSLHLEHGTTITSQISSLMTCEMK